jgi:nitrogen fixation/metabolism regulation signal transduction histidine kinase
MIGIMNCVSIAAVEVICQKSAISENIYLHRLLVDGGRVGANMGIDAISAFSLVNKKVNRCSEGLFLVDKEGTVRFLNEKGREIFSKIGSIQQGDNIFNSALAPFFLSTEKHEKTGVIERELYRDGQIIKLKIEAIISGNEEEEQGWVCAVDIHTEPDSFGAGGQNWGTATEELVQQLSLRYAHEVLNALTPVYGILQMIKDERVSAGIDTGLLELAQNEVNKSKNFVNDFMYMNYPGKPAPKWHTAGQLLAYIKEKTEEQTPEFIPHLDWKIAGEEDILVQVDAHHLRTVLQLLIKKWIDFAKSHNVITITFHTNDQHFYVIINQPEMDETLYFTDSEFNYYLHLAGKVMEINEGKLQACGGVKLTFIQPGGLNG